MASKKREKQRQVKSKSAAILLAIFFAPFTFLYTWKDDKTKFWVSLLLTFLLFWTVVVPIVIWIYAIVVASTRDKEWYEDY